MAASRGVRPGDFLVAVHDFDARSPDELTFRRGDKIELVELDEGFGDGWYLGKHAKTGASGLFPGVYTAVTPKIPIRHQQDEFDNNDLSQARRDDERRLSEGVVNPSVPVRCPNSEDEPSQTSRHVSASTFTVAEAAASQPEQPQAPSSSTRPTAVMAADLQQTIRQSIDDHLNGKDSPVINETLSVIDEHITDLSTPRHSFVAQDQKFASDSGSEYSSHISRRMSYINGHETDEEEENQPEEEQVRTWNPKETAKRLRDLGIEPRHCEIFEEQEISGDVLLDMDQNFIFMKEFDFGVMGRRLKTWHRIKAFQEEIKGPKTHTRGSLSTLSSLGDLLEGRSHSRAGHTGPLLPRIPSLSERSPMPYPPPSRGSIGSAQHSRLVSPTPTSIIDDPKSPQTAYGMNLPRRPSAASVREFNHSRRHSSIDTTGRSPRLLETSSGVHHKKPSLDQAWTMSSAGGDGFSRSGTSLGTTSDGLLPHHIFQGFHHDDSDLASSMDNKFEDLERGYFSGTEVDSRRRRRVLHKQDLTSGSMNHSRNSSHADINQGHVRVSSATINKSSEAHVSPASTAYHDESHTSRFRSLSSQVSGTLVHQASTASLTAKSDANGSGGSSPLPLQQIKNVAPKFRRAVGLRAISDVITKGIDASAAQASPVREHDPTSARTGSTTPSATSFRSSDRPSTDGSGKVIDGVAASRPRPSVRSVKSKKDTSAYTQGLEKKTPQEQMDGCDYYGWMKKRSSHIMTTWKPRLFILRGRRLSYYYSEHDKEERGLIDITAHRVLRADGEPIIALHATLTGASATTTSSGHSRRDQFTLDKGPSSADARRTQKSEQDGPFYFKLVPPRTSSRTVQFTKPAVHYFQVDNVKQGRLWMAALMKATIERDVNLPVETTNKQKTISLKQARLMNQRPPALMNAVPSTEAKAATETGGSVEQDNGLLIKGLSFDKSNTADHGPEEQVSASSHIGCETGSSSLVRETDGTD